MTRQGTTSSLTTGNYATRLLALLLLAAIIYLLGNGLFPLIDRDEPRYAQASRQMLESGDWVTPQYLDQLRLKKPILIYWLQATAMKHLGDTAFAARLPSVIASLLTLALFAVTFPRVVGYRRALWAVFIFATMLLPSYIAKVCMTDAVLHLFIATAMLCLYAIWSGAFRPWMILPLGCAIGLSILTKGPPVFLYLGMTLVALWILNLTTRTHDKLAAVRIARFVPNFAIGMLLVGAIAAAICLPWAMKLEAAHPGVLLSMLKKEAIDRATEPQEGHSGPPGFYFVTFWGTALPWCLFWPAALWYGWKRRAVPWVRSCLAAIFGPWVFLEFYQTKLPHYWLPSYPFMALLIADVLVRAIRGSILDLSDRAFVNASTIACGIVALLGLSVIATPWFGDSATFASYATSILLALAIPACAWGVARLIRQQQLSRAAIVMGLSFWAILTFALSIFVPSNPAFTLAQRVGTSLRSLGATNDVRMIEFKEPSLAFYQGGTIREQSEGGLTDLGPRWIVIDHLTFQASPMDAREAYSIHKTFSGLNLADGKLRQTVHVLERKSKPATLREPN